MEIKNTQTLMYAWVFYVFNKYYLILVGGIVSLLNSSPAAP
jgi:hypothetical protein